jgi:hypothetical protein
MKVVRLSALPTGRLYPQEGLLVLISIRGWVDSRGHNAIEWVKSLKNSTHSIGNRTRDLPACSAVLQPSAPPRTPHCQLLASVSLDSLNCRTLIPKFSPPQGHLVCRLDDKVSKYQLCKAYLLLVGQFWHTNAGDVRRNVTACDERNLGYLGRCVCRDCKGSVRLWRGAVGVTQTVNRAPSEATWVLLLVWYVKWTTVWGHVWFLLCFSEVCYLARRTLISDRRIWFWCVVHFFFYHSLPLILITWRHLTFST